MKNNYVALTEKIIAGFKDTPVRPRLLLHSCCAPCSSYALSYLAPHFDTSVFFYNPNIRPECEYEKRLYWQRLLVDRIYPGTKLIAPAYLSDEFSLAISGLESEPEGAARCSRCFRLRLEATAKAAMVLGFPWFCSTLTVSPHKNADTINAIGLELAGEYGLSWLPSDFKKRGGYQRSIEFSRKYGLYRQNYCGCLLGNNVVK